MFTGLLFALGAAVTWGLVYTVNEKVLHDAAPLAILFIGSIVTALITLPVLVFRWDSVRHVVSGGRSLWALVVLGEVLVFWPIFSFCRALSSWAPPTRLFWR